VHGYAAPDVETLLAEFADGCHLTLRCNWCGGANQDLLTLVGTEGILLVGALEDTTFTLRRRGRPDEVCTVAPPAQNRHLPLIADFAQRLGRGEAPRHDGWAGFQATRLMAGCYRSAAGGLVVEV
jgi:predicted dehydrogenase